MHDQDNNEPLGIGFFNIRSRDTHYARLEPTIQAYINSSDMGINASRGQDFGWRLASEWVHMVRDFRKDENKMANLGAKLRLEEDESPSLTQILFSIYGSQIRAARLREQEAENPYEEEYLEAISDKKRPKSQTSEELANFDRIADQDEPTPAPEEEPGAPPKEEPHDGDSSESTDSAASATEPSEEVNAASDSDKSADSKTKPATPKKK